LHTLTVLRPPFVHTLILTFFFNIIAPFPLSRADELHLPRPGVMVHLSPEFNPPVLKGIKVYPNNPFQFEFILDKGDNQLDEVQLKEESNKLIKYFLASLTIPEKDLWVNLSPYEKDRVVPELFGQTEMGRDLLAEDYMLKQITASLIYPGDAVGKKFWKRIYEEASKRYGTTDIPVNTFNKVWIVPENVVVYENVKIGAAYVVESKLKVMLEQDYLSLEKHEGIATSPKTTNQLGSQIVREIVIPELTKEVNENKNFGNLRQIYNSLILATWYKRKIKDSTLTQVYADKSKVEGVNIENGEKERIYQQYIQAFKKGVYNYIKEDIDPLTQERIAKKYFSGGVNFFGDMAMKVTNHFNSDQLNPPSELIVSSQIKMVTKEVVEKNLLLNQFWTKQVKELDITDILGSTAALGQFNLGFRFEGNGFSPGQKAIGVGPIKPLERIIMKEDEDGRIIFERRMDKEVIQKAIWVKDGNEWKNEENFLLDQFWTKKTQELDITQTLGGGVVRGRFNESFRFEGQGYQPGQVNMGIGPGEKEDKVVMRWNGSELIFERKREEKVQENAIWIKQGNMWIQKKEENLLKRFWKRQIPEVDITEAIGSGVITGAFNPAFQFDNGYQPGRIAIGINGGREEDRVVMKWDDDGRLIFQRYREGNLVQSASWIRQGDSWIHNKNVNSLKQFWKKEIQEADITEIIRSGVDSGKFNVNFQFEEGGYQPGQIAIGIGKGKEGDTVLMKWYGKKKRIIFERHRDNKIFKSAVWIKQGKEWKYDEKSTVLNQFWTREVQDLDLTGLMSEDEKRYGIFNAAFRFEENGYNPGSGAIGVGFGKKEDSIVMKWSGEGRITFDRQRGNKTVESAVWRKQGRKWQLEKPIVRTLLKIFNEIGGPLKDIRFLDIKEGEVREAIENWVMNRFEGIPYRSRASALIHALLFETQFDSSHFLEMGKVLNRGEALIKFESDFKKQQERLNKEAEAVEVSSPVDDKVIRELMLAPNLKIRRQMVNKLYLYLKDEYQSTEQRFGGEGMEVFHEVLNRYDWVRENAGLENLKRNINIALKHRQPYLYYLNHPEGRTILATTRRLKKKGLSEEEIDRYLMKEMGYSSGDVNLARKNGMQISLDKDINDGATLYDFIESLQQIDPQDVYQDILPERMVHLNILGLSSDIRASTLSEALDLFWEKNKDFKDGKSKEMAAAIHQGKLVTFIDDQQVNIENRRIFNNPLERDLNLSIGVSSSPQSNKNSANENVIDDAQKVSNKGGIDLNTMNLSIQNNGEEIKFNINPTQLKELQNAPGFSPVIIDIQPMTSLPEFLGLNAQ
jgi:hypothetical protein